MRVFILSALCGVAAATSGMAEQRGTPIAGETATVETTSAIVQRAKTARATAPFMVPEHEGPAHQPLAREPRLRLEGPMATVHEKALSTTIPQRFGVNFLGGTTFTSAQTYPPDTMGAVGATQFIVAVNGFIKTFNKATGAADNVMSVAPSTFFASKATTSVTDPRIRYDRLSGRWFMVIIDRKSTGNQVLVAVSQTSTITSSSQWSFFAFVPEPTAFADYPTLAVDSNALYIGTNNFNGSSFAGSSFIVVRKSSVLGAGPIVTTTFHSASIPEMFTPHGADNADPNATEGYVIAADTHLFSRLDLRRVSDPAGTPVLSDNVPLDTPIDYVDPIDVHPLESSSPVDGLDTRLMNAVYRQGHLWAAHNVGVDNSGASATSITRTRNAMRWYDITGVESGATPAFAQAGTVYNPSVSNTADQRNYWDGSLNVSGQGHAVLGMTAAGSQEYLNAAVTTRLNTDPANTFRDPVLFTDSTSGYNIGGSPMRWGDYSFTSVDPDDDMTMWTIQEFAVGTNNWGVQALQLIAPPPATPVSCSPSSATRGSGAVTVVVTGNAVNGTGFFDPGAGFPKHLTASISEPGVTVTSVEYTDPTHITLHLTVSSAATAGPRTVQITNPDGQTISADNIFAIDPADPSTLFLPAVTTGAATSLTSASAVLNGTVMDDGGGAIDHRSFSLTDNVNPPITIDDSGIVVSGNSFSAQVSGLSPNTNYSFTAYAHNQSPKDNGAGVGWGAGSSVGFTTVPPQPTAATPVFSPNGGTFRRKVAVKMSCATAGAAIHYTTNGAEPTESSPRYVAGRRGSGITISGAGVHVVKAIATNAGYNASAVATATFTIN